ncbi:MAG TPA: PKD domain-containing protein [Candidatus Hydrogenedentes bacterium]|nr:PKD domain-containing protein [Candidatus Hydrogenedentota bacterium]
MKLILFNTCKVLTLQGILLMAAIALTGCPQTPFTVEFYADPRVGDMPMTVSFYDATDIGNAKLKSRLWELGDGTQSSDPSFQHVYTTPGKYTVTLILDTNKGIGSLTIPNCVIVRGKFRVLVRNTGDYPLEIFYLALVSAADWGNNRIIQPILPGDEIDLGQDFKQDGYIIGAAFDVDGYLESVQYTDYPGYFDTIGMLEEYLLVEAYYKTDGEKGLTAVPMP